MAALFPPLLPVSPAPTPDSASTDHPPELVALKQLVWLYFWLLIFEGALRKWAFPGLSNSLLLVRDPVVLLIYIAAGIAGVIPRNGLIAFTAVLAAVSVVISEAYGSGNLLVTLYGFRTSFLHLPLILILPHALSRTDLIKMARWILVICLPMFLLVLLQFQASPDAWINNGAGGGIGAQLPVGFGKIRPPGTFSFTGGLASFLWAAAAIAVGARMCKDLAPRFLLAVAQVAIAGMVLVSGSRGAVCGIGFIFLGVGFVCAIKPKLAGRSVRMMLGLGILLLALSLLAAIREGLDVHQARFEDSGGLIDGLLLRVLGGLLEPFYAAVDAPFFGIGLGMGTNAATLTLDGAVNFKLGEGDWGRTIREVGPVLGFLHIALRLSFLGFLARRAFDSLLRDNPLPTILFTACCFELLNGQFGVPSLLGLAVFKGGLCLAATNLDAASVPASQEEFATQPPVVAHFLPGFRGRSAYSEQLHQKAEDPLLQRFGP